MKLLKWVAVGFAVLIAPCVGRLYLDFRCWSLLRHAKAG
jgi:hypothetical protein